MRGRARLQRMIVPIVIVGLTSMVVGIAMIAATGTPHGVGTPAFADSSAYELYCPGTPVGNLVLNDAVTTGSLSPAAPSAGQSFSLTNYQTVVNLPASLADAFAALGNSDLAGSFTAQLDASGATPATTPQGPLSFDVPIPSPVPAAGVTLSLPPTPATVSGFTATSGAITIQEDSSFSMTLTVSGSALTLTCSAYPNNTAASGIVSTGPTAAPVAPVIATAGGGSTATTEAPTTTTTSGATTTTTASTTTTGATTTTTASTTTTSAPAPLQSSNGSSPVEAGSTITVTGSGFLSGETVDFGLFSVRIDLGTATADPNGDVSKTVTIPPGTATGTHTITATGETSGHMEAVSLTVGSSVAPSTTQAQSTTTTILASSAQPSPSVAVTSAQPTSSGTLAFSGAGSDVRWIALAGSMLVTLTTVIQLALYFTRRRPGRASSLVSDSAAPGRGADYDFWLLGRDP